MRGPHLLLCALLLASTGCTATFQNGGAAGPEQTEWSHFFLFGWIGHDEMEARDLCDGAPFSRVRTGENGLTVGATLLTLGIYTPRRVVYACEAPTK